MSLEDVMAKSFEAVADSVPESLAAEVPAIEEVPATEAEATETEPESVEAVETEAEEPAGKTVDKPTGKKENRSFEGRIAQKHAFAMEQKERADKAESDLGYWQDAAKKIAVAYKELEAKKTDPDGSYEESEPKVKTYSPEEIEVLVQQGIDKAFEERKSKSVQEQNAYHYQQRASELEKHIMEAYADRFDESVNSFDDEAHAEVQTLINAFKTAPNFWLEKVKKEGVVSVVGFLTNKPVKAKVEAKKTAKDVLAEKRKIDLEDSSIRANATPAKAEKGLNSVMERIFATLPKK